MPIKIEAAKIPPHLAKYFQVSLCSSCYICHSLVFLKEIWRVLRKDGVVFWNIDDSRNGSGGDHKKGGKNDAGFQGDLYRGCQPRNAVGLKPKDLCLIPQRLAIAAQGAGWYVRSQIIWHKQNGMPESVTDRPTDNYEIILMLTKSGKYYYDAEAVKQPYVSIPNHDLRDKASEKYTDTGLFSQGGRDYYSQGGANLRSVWTFPTASSGYKHYAAFPEELPERCIKAATKEGDTVLDCFTGTGTTLWVAKRLNRKAIGFEISSKYSGYALDRNRQGVIL